MSPSNFALLLLYVAMSARQRGIASAEASLPLVMESLAEEHGLMPWEHIEDALFSCEELTEVPEEALEAWTRALERWVAQPIEQGDWATILDSDWVESLPPSVQSVWAALPESMREALEIFATKSAILEEESGLRAEICETDSSSRTSDIEWGDASA